MGMYDKTLRELFQDIPYKLIKLLTNQNIIKVLDSHFPKVEEREADLVVELEDGNIFHLEIQSINDKFMPKRMLYYALLIDKIYNKFPKQLVLYVGIDKIKIKSFLKTENLYYTYNVIDIRNIDCKELINSESINDNIIAILCNIENADKFFEKITQKLISLDNKQREDYLRKLIILARLRPNLYTKLENFYKEKKMPFILETKKDPLYNKGWNEAWDEAWNEAENKRKIEDAIIMIKEFNLPIESVANKLNISKDVLLKYLKG